jgi:hypothetical protein
MRKKLLITIATAYTIAVGSYFTFTQPKKTHPIPSINSFHDVQNILARLGPDDFVFFDVDDTLLTARDHLPKRFAPPLHFQILSLARYPQLLKKGYGEQVFSDFLLQAPRMLTENSAPQIIRQLKQQGVRVLIITGMESGSFGNIESMPAWRRVMLDQMGISFNDEFKNVTFEGFPAYRGNYPVLYNGLICCNQQAKGDVIEAFFKHFNLKPSIAVLFDDSQEELPPFNKTCLQRNITPLCFHYKGAKKITVMPWSTRLTFVQLHELIKQKRWLSDLEAVAKLKSNFFSFLW